MIPEGQIQYQKPPRPGSLIAAFIIGLIGSLLELIFGILLVTASYFVASWIIGNISSSLVEYLAYFLETAATVIGAVYIISGGIMLLLWIFAFIGKEGARIALIVILSIDLLIQLFSLNLINFILDIVLISLISNRSVAEYCNPRYQQYRQFNYNQVYNQIKVDQNVRENVRENVRDEKYTPVLENRTVPYLLTPKTFAVLISESGPLRGQTFKLNPKNSYIIGRAGDITIPSEDKTTSREHAKIRDENSNFVIYDMGSTNHTYVNGERVDRKILLDGDRIKIGQNIFRFQIVRGK